MTDEVARVEIDGLANDGLEIDGQENDGTKRTKNGGLTLTGYRRSSSTCLIRGRRGWRICLQFGAGNMPQ